MQTKHLAIRSLLWFVCLYHLVIGISANLPAPQVQSAARLLLGLEIPDSPATLQILRAFGVYLVAFGCAMGLAAWNPVKNRALISLGIVLCVFRLIQRLSDLQGVEDAFGVSNARNLFTIAVIAFITILLGILRWRLYREMHVEGVQRNAR